MAVVALTGAVIIEDGSTIQYKHKCEKCGWVENGTHRCAAPSAGYLASSFLCLNCKQTQEVKIQKV
jgi:hypothetical protein